MEACNGSDEGLGMVSCSAVFLPIAVPVWPSGLV